MESNDEYFNLSSTDEKLLESFLELRAKYQLVFAKSDIGIEVLTSILSMCHFGEWLNSENKQQIGEYNVGIAILKNLGIFGKGNDLDPVIRNLINSIPKEVVK